MNRGVGQPPASTLAQIILREGPLPARSAEIGACSCPQEVKAGLFLLNGDWKLSHETCQDLQSSTGAHWHALVHRHEPDFPNSKYWLRRVGESLVYPVLLSAAAQSGQAHRVVVAGAWDAMLFTDFFADASHRSWTRPLDELEKRTLLDHCLLARA